MAPPQPSSQRRRPAPIGSKTHIYADNGEYTVSVKVSEAGTAPTPSDTKTFKVNVANVAPTATFSNDGPVNEGSSFKLTLSNADDVSSVDKAAGFTYAFDCGDGSGYGAYGNSAESSCSTNDSGSRSVKAKVRDKDGGEREYTATVQVNNVAPTATFGNNGPVAEGSSFKVTLTGADDVSSVDKTAGFTYQFDCGDGSGYGAYGNSSERSCATTDNGTRNVKGKVKDKDDGEREYTGTVTVNNVGPTITSFTGTDYITGPLAYIGGGPSQSTFQTTFTDPGADNPWTAAFTYADGTPLTDSSLRSNTNPFSLTHQFTGAGCAKSATVKVTDKDGAVRHEVDHRQRRHRRVPAASGESAGLRQAEERPGPAGQDPPHGLLRRRGYEPHACDPAREGRQDAPDRELGGPDRAGVGQLGGHQRRHARHGRRRLHLQHARGRAEGRSRCGVHDRDLPVWRDQWPAARPYHRGAEVAGRSQATASSPPGLTPISTSANSPM